MGKFDIDETLKPRKRLMLMVGLWPEGFPTLVYRLKGHAVFSILTTIVILVPIQVCRDLGDWEGTSFSICCAMAAFHCAIKHVMVFSNKPQFYKMINSLKQPILAFHDDHFDVFLQDKVRLCNLCIPALFFAGLGTVCIAILCPLFDAKKERPLIYGVPIDMMQQPLFVYFAIYGYQIIAMLIMGWTIPCYDGVNFTFIAIASAQLKIIREKIIHAADCLSSVTSLQSRQQKDVVVNDILKECVKHQIAIERYINLIENTFSNGFLIQLLITLIGGCFVGITLLVLPVMSLSFMRGVILLIGMLIELIFYCVPGNEIIIQSEKIRDACYMSEWTECGASVRKTLFIIMERSKRPLVLTAANFVNLSLETLVNVVRNSFSYFTVLIHLYKNTSEPQRN